jgi:hypothetical protein
MPKSDQSSSLLEEEFSGIIIVSKQLLKVLYFSSVLSILSLAFLVFSFKCLYSGYSLNAFPTSPACLFRIFMVAYQTQQLLFLFPNQHIVESSM